MCVDMYYMSRHSRLSLLRSPQYKRVPPALAGTGTGGLKMKPKPQDEDFTMSILAGAALAVIMGPLAVFTIFAMVVNKFEGQ